MSSVRCTTNLLSSVDGVHSSIPQEDLCRLDGVNTCMSVCISRHHCPSMIMVSMSVHENSPNIDYQ